MPWSMNECYVESTIFCLSVLQRGGCYTAAPIHTVLQKRKISLNIRRLRVGVKSGGDLRPIKLGNFVAFENASRVFRNGLVWFIGCMWKFSNPRFVRGPRGGWEI